MKPPLTAFKMEWHEADGEHDELVLGMPVLTEACEHPDRYPHVTVDQLADAAEFGAGLLGRIAAHAIGEIALEAQNHGCRRQGSVIRSEVARGRVIVTEGCALSGPDSLLTPRAGFGEHAPELWFVVPKGHITVWRERVNGWLQQITDDRPTVTAQRSAS